MVAGTSRRETRMISQVRQLDYERGGFGLDVGLDHVVVFERLPGGSPCNIM
jgi:hypothetical protein